MRQKLMLILTTAAVTGMMAATAFAGTWKQDASGTGKWQYDNGDGTYASNGWHWIDGNGDGTAECYYFDGAGWLLANTTTPDGYQVDGNGAWVQNGTVQTKSVTGNSTAQNSAGRFSHGTWGWDYESIDMCSMKYLKEDGTWAKWGEKIVEDGKEYSFMPNGYSHEPVEGYYTPKKTVEEIIAENNAKTSTDNDVEDSWDADIDEYIEKTLELMNKKRRKAGVGEVVIDDTLMEAAAIRAEELSEKFSHIRPNGETWYTVLDEVGFDYDDHDPFTYTVGTDGEIITQTTDPKTAIANFMGSSGHKRMMLRDDHTITGIGIYPCEGSGRYSFVIILQD